MSGFFLPAAGFWMGKEEEEEEEDNRKRFQWQSECVVVFLVCTLVESDTSVTPSFNLERVGSFPCYQNLNIR